jgi:hypothetical protein
MFVKNSFEYDARVTKEAKSLIGAGHEVTVVAIHVPGATRERETTADGIDVVRVSRLSFGMHVAQQAHARFVVGVERRHAERTGEAIDEERIRKYAQVLPASTATPGQNHSVEIPQIEASTTPPRRYAGPRGRPGSGSGPSKRWRGARCGPPAPSPSTAAS